MNETNKLVCGEACQGQTHHLIGNILKFWRKKSAVNTELFMCYCKIK